MRCPDCKGIGKIIDIGAPIIGYLPCYICKGSGKTWQLNFNCPICEGSGKIAQYKLRYCTRCKGKGNIEE